MCQVSATLVPGNITLSPRGVRLYCGSHEAVGPHSQSGSENWGAYTHLFSMIHHLPCGERGDRPTLAVHPGLGALASFETDRWPNKEEAKVE